jgi:hypothetical protein
VHLLHALAALIPPWPPAARMLSVKGWRFRSGDVALPSVSSQWLREFDIVSSKRQGG